MLSILVQPLGLDAATPLASDSSQKNQITQPVSIAAAKPKKPQQPVAAPASSTERIAALQTSIADTLPTVRSRAQALLVNARTQADRNKAQGYLNLIASWEAGQNQRHITDLINDTNPRTRARSLATAITVLVRWSTNITNAKNDLPETEEERNRRGTNPQPPAPAPGPARVITRNDIENLQPITNRVRTELNGIRNNNLTALNAVPNVTSSTEISALMTQITRAIQTANTGRPNQVLANGLRALQTELQTLSMNMDASRSTRTTFATALSGTEPTIEALRNASTDTLQAKLREANGFDPFLLTQMPAQPFVANILYTRQSEGQGRLSGGDIDPQTNRRRDTILTITLVSRGEDGQVVRDEQFQISSGTRYRLALQRRDIDALTARIMADNGSIARIRQDLANFLASTSR